MNTGHDGLIDEFAPTVDASKRLTTWYAQGHSDGLGDRLLMFDNTSAPSWEILRFRPALAANPLFEAALRQRVERLGTLRHPSFPAVRPIAELGQDDGLAVVSTYASGVCLAEGLKKPRSAAFAVRLLRQVVPAVAALQQHAPGIAHGALTLDRMVLTGEGRLMVREHMVGSALNSLELPAIRLWEEFGLLTAPSDSTAPLDERTDVIQLALVVLSLMAGRRIGLGEYPVKIRELLDQIEDKCLWHEPETFRALRGWLERALQIGDPVFESARDAQAALAEWKDQPERSDEQASVHLASKRSIVRDAPIPPPTTPAAAALPPPAPFSRRDSRAFRWAAVVVGVLAVGEAAFIGRLLMSGSSARPVLPASAEAVPKPRVDARGADQPAIAPLHFDVAAVVAPTGTLPTLAVAASNANVPELQSAAAVKDSQAKVTGVPPGPMTAPMAAVKSGGFRVSSPVEVHVLDGERVLGSSADGPIIVPAGPREYEFVNSAIGYRARRVVDVKAGAITSLSVNIPNGTLNINATPWAAVSIDGNSYGETPLGNVSVVPGEHEIVFRHPQLGERREKVMVRPDAATRIAVSMR